MLSNFNYMIVSMLLFFLILVFIYFLWMMKMTWLIKTNISISMIGCLYYVTDCISFSIVYAVGLFSSFISKSSSDYWYVMKCLIKYLFSMKNYDLFYKKYFTVFEVFSDVDWNILSRYFFFIMGYMFMLRGGVMGLKFNKRLLLLIKLWKLSL